jgi:hypothetical protein
MSHTLIDWSLVQVQQGQPFKLFIIKIVSKSKAGAMYSQLCQKIMNANAVGRQHHASILPIWRFGTFRVLLFGLLLCAFSSVTMAQPVSDASKERILPTFEPLAAILPVLAAIRLEIDHSQFDRNALLEKLDYDEEKIITFARDEIAFEAYTGLLRGADGTLMSAAGNALDQAVFLGGMLRAAGFDARVVEGEMSPEDASRLASGMRDVRTMKSPFKDDSKVERLIDRLNAPLPDADRNKSLESGGPGDDFDNVRTVAHAVIKGIRDAGAQLGSSVMRWEDIVNESQRYYWVQYRSAPSAGWVDLHPAFGSRSAPNAVAQRYFDDRIPEDLTHRLRISTFISQRVGDKLHEKLVMPPWERPMANLVGMTIRYMNFPDGLAQQSEDKENFDDSVAQVKEAIGASRFFHPMFNGQIVTGGNSFDLRGNIVPSDVAGNFMAGLFQEQAVKLGSAIAALSDKDDSDGELMSLVEHWIQFEMITPGGQTRTIKRFLLTADHEGDNRALALTREVSISVEPGRPSVAKYLDEKLDLLATAARILEALDDEKSTTPLGDIQPLMEKLVSHSSGAVNLDSLVSTSNLSEALGAVKVYRPQGSIVASYQSALGMATDLSAPTGFDILTDFNYAWIEGNGSGGGLTISPEKTVEVGIAQTMLESHARFPGNERGANAFLDWDKSDPQRTVVITRESNLGNGLAENSSTRYLIQDIEKGYLTIMQPVKTASGSPSTWWRVHPETAETLGMTEAGWGGLTFFSLLSVSSFEYKMFLVRANAMVGPAKVTGAIAKCQGIIAAFSIGEQINLIGEQAGHVSTELGLLLQLIGMSLTSVQAALHSPAGYEAFMKRCVIRQIWR